MRFSKILIDSPNQTAAPSTSQKPKAGNLHTFAATILSILLSWKTHRCHKQSGKAQSHLIVEGSLEVELPTIWTGKAKVGRVREERKRQKKEDAGARKGRKVAKHCGFPLICGSGGSKSRFAKAEKLHAVVARSTFPSQNVQNTPLSDHFWKLRCRKSARRCGAQHISKSKCTKHTRFGPLLEVEMSKKCTPLWREAHFEVKMYKTHQLRTTFTS